MGRRNYVQPFPVSDYLVSGTWVININSLAQCPHKARDNDMVCLLPYNQFSYIMAYLRFFLLTYGRPDSRDFEKLLAHHILIATLWDTARVTIREE